MESDPTPTVVLHACLGVGHLIPMVELAKLLLRRGLAVVIAVPTPPASTADFFSSSASAVDRLAAANPSISFHRLSPPEYPDPDPDAFLQMLDTMRLTVPSLVAFLRTIPSVAALVLDLFCIDALDAAAAAGVPAYLYYTSAAGDLAAFLHLPHYFATTMDGVSFKDMGKTLLRFPGVPPIPASDMPHTVLDRADRTFSLRIGHYRRMPEARGVLINTYQWLEARAVAALREGVCVPNRPTPPVYCIGPLIVKGEETAKGERHPCLSWLDAQPERSVVFLCFGSMGAVSVEQLKEIALGLESSGHRFLWVVRSPPQDPAKFFLPRPESDLGVLLPEGFMERTRDRGIVVGSWAPQVDVLRHAATGAFVTHCGWNSVLEAASAGVPMVCWPQYAEQRLNKVFVVEEMRLGVVMDGYDEELVKADEVEKKVRLVMDSVEGNKLRERLAMAKEMAAEALSDGESSSLAFTEFLKDLKFANSPNNQTVVLHPTLGVGHLIPMVELAKLFLNHGYAVIIAIPTPPASAADIAASSAPAVERITAANPSITFHRLPPPDYPVPDADGFQQMLEVVRLSLPPLVAFLRSLPSVAAFIADLFCVDALQAAAEAVAGVPAYIYFTSAAGDLAAFLHLPHHFATTDGDMRDMGKDQPLHFPGVPPIPASDITHHLLDRANAIGAAMVEHYRRMAASARGVLINTYEWMEATAVAALRDGVCVPGHSTPPVYCIGPLIVSSARAELHQCLAWLDSQPDKTVVFLSFGSMGAVSADQIKEIAHGLEKSGHRFLWVVRSPPDDPAKIFLRRPEPDLAAILPDGFMERTRDRGMVVKSWAPQVDVLRHAATGAFVTHCRWNSTLEAVAAGVSMVCWPQYTEQRLNKVLVVDGMRLGVVMDGYDEEIVTAEEVEKVGLVMETEDGEKLRERLALAKEMAAEAMADGGPSRMAFAEFLKDLERSK
uniref:Uncharacterized protein n=1 Tax=Leersia perrieri TaxID=77586 RepID=A0A0D9WIV8_9ORYZ